MNHQPRAGGSSAAGLLLGDERALALHGDDQTLVAQNLDALADGPAGQAGRLLQLDEDLGRGAIETLIVSTQTEQRQNSAQR